PDLADTLCGGVARAGSAGECVTARSTGGVPDPDCGPNYTRAAVHGVPTERCGYGRYRVHGSPGGPECRAGTRVQARGPHYPRLGRGGASAHRATTYSYTGRSPGVTARNPPLGPTAKSSEDEAI